MKLSGWGPHGGNGPIRMAMELRDDAVNLSKRAVVKAVEADALVAMGGAEDLARPTRDAGVLLRGGLVLSGTAQTPALSRPSQRADVCRPASLLCFGIDTVLEIYPGLVPLAKKAKLAIRAA